MKKLKSTFFFISLLLIGLSSTSCDDDDNGNNNNEVEEEIRVESVEWKSDLQNGFELSISDNSLNVANRISFLKMQQIRNKHSRLQTCILLQLQIRDK